VDQDNAHRAIFEDHSSCGKQMVMPGMRKITVQVLEDDLRKAQAVTGRGIAGTVRIALKELRSAHAQRKVLALRGKVTFRCRWTRCGTTGTS
jgi:hypothetical protein